MKKYEWVIVGGGVAGIAISEILTREGHEVLLIEKNSKLASGVTKDFHEWMHMGSLYTLIPDRLVTLKYILGAVDDLIEYYSAFENMNLISTENSFEMDLDNPKRWYNKNYIHFKFRVQNRKLTFPWLMGIARAKFLIEYIQHHDWLRRRAGVIDISKKDYINSVIKTFKELVFYKDKFLPVKTADFTMNSRNLLRDLVATSVNNGLEVSLENEVLDFYKENNEYIINTKKGKFKADKIVLSCAENIKNFLDVKIQTTYAPMAVVDNLPKDAYSFVELDYFPKNCINLLTKDGSAGLIGGITVNKMEDTENYINYVIREHKKYFPNMRVLKKYVGLKNEIVFPGQDRNYLYHIVKEDNENVWSVVPGKFSLAFSLAPEFYRQVYKTNPRKSFKTYSDNGEYTELVDNTKWQESIKTQGENNGND